MSKPGFRDAKASTFRYLVGSQQRISTRRDLIFQWNGEEISRRKWWNIREIHWAIPAFCGDYICDYICGKCLWWSVVSGLLVNFTTTDTLDDSLWWLRCSPPNPKVVVAWVVLCDATSPHTQPPPNSSTQSLSRVLADQILLLCLL